ncbi:FAD-binding oxidoreductase [Salinimonas sp. HHU 13199]|uniref:FAD-binding oxidoreductase n=1 Tax=Salinimonas profundi TaxID=2729140 RepID=A0ABR8LQ16_9ALTE|nr:FAD-binding oxidoreductase [Salinimonas profundi]MBD3586189.1 FAD-binding oxidoreductase [Salinimonas profundi]
MSYDPLIDSAVNPQESLPPTYWHDTVEVPSGTALNKDIETDFLVIGAGYTGISAALALTESRAGSVTVIDSHSPGYGCAGRNAGFVLSGSGRMGPSALEKRYGLDIAKGIQNEYDGAVSDLLARISAYGIDCDLAAGPYYKLAHTAKHALQQRRSADYLKTNFNQQIESLSQDQLKKALAVEGFYGASRQPGHTLNPLKLILGLSHTAQSKGAAIYSATPALKITRGESNHVVETPQGVITARTLLIASNAYTSKVLHPAVNKRQFPVQSSILVTQPLSKTQLAAIGFNGPVSMMDTRMMKYYYRLLPDNRLLFGGRGEVSARQAHAGKARLYDAMLTSFPVLRGIDISHFWSGWVSVSLDNLPRVNFDNRTQTGYAMGYCGAGVSFANFAGRRLAQRAMNQPVDLNLPLYSTPLRRFPFAGLRRSALRALYGWARVIER